MLAGECRARADVRSARCVSRNQVCRADATCGMNSGRASRKTRQSRRHAAEGFGRWSGPECSWHVTVGAW